MATVPCVEDSCSLDLEITDENKLTGEVILDPDGGLICTENEGVGINLGGASCGISAVINGANQLDLGIDYDTARGLDCDGNGLYVKLNPSACNAISHTVSGLYSADHDHEYAEASATVADLGVVGVSQGAFGSILCDVDAFFAAYAGTGGFPANQTPGIETSLRAQAQLTNNTCRTMLFRLAYAGIPRISCSNGWTIYNGVYQNRNFPVGGFTQEAPFIEVNTSTSPYNANAAVGYTFPPRIYGAGGLTLFPGQTVTAEVAASLQIANGPGQVPPGGNSVEWRFGTSVTIEAWTID
jgi:hypothetical protein